MVLAARDRRHAAFGGAVALHHDHAEVLPGQLQRRREERRGRHDQVQRPAEFAMDGVEESPPDGVGEAPRHEPRRVEEPLPSLRRGFALDRRPEQLHDLRHDHECRGAVVADRLEHDSRVVAADIHDVRPDAHGVVDQRHLLEEVRQGQQ